jgi:tetratricopeptide (TPR) repeat protein
MVRATPALLAAVVAMAVPATAVGQPAPAAAAVSPESAKKAKALFDAGGRAYESGQFDVALQAFEQAYAIYPKETLLFSMAQAHRRLFVERRSPDHRDHAIRLFREYLQRVSAGKRRAEATAAIGELEAAAPPAGEAAPAAPPAEKKKTRVFVSSSTPGATVSVDGGPMSPPSTTFEVAPGKHKVRLVAPGFAERTIEIEAFAEEVVPVTMDLTELPGAVRIRTADGASVSVDGRFIGDAPLAAPIDLPAGTHFVSAELAGHRTVGRMVAVARGKRHDVDVELDTTVQRDVSYAIFGVAGASATVFAVLAGIAYYHQGRARDLLDQQQATGLSYRDAADYEDAKQERDLYAIGAAVSGGVAGALAVTGLGMFLGDPPDRAVPPPRVEAPPGGATPPPGDKPGLDEVVLAPALGPGFAGAVGRVTF